MFDFFWSLAAFIVAIGVLVSFHEFGHYWVARRLGVKVLRFSIGFGRPLWLWRSRDGVEWAISAIPLGGYVKMLDEREGEVAPSERAFSFNRQPPWKRILIVIAGPAFNFLLAVVFYWAVLVMGVTDRRPLVDAPAAGTRAAVAGIVAGDEIIAVGAVPIANWTELSLTLVDQALDAGIVPLKLKSADGSLREVQLSMASVRPDPEFLFDDLGLQPYRPPIPPVLKEVTPGGAALAAGFAAGDRLLSRDGVAIASWQDWASFVRANPGRAVSVEFQRGTEKQTKQVIVGKEVENGAVIGRFGAAVELPADLVQNLSAEYRLDVISAWPAAVRQTWQMSALTLKLLYRMVLGDISVKNVGGPIQIAQFAGDTASIGLVSFLSFLAIISLSLGVLNLLPVPVLDGGHLLYYIVEWIKGSPLSDRVQAIGQQVGITALVALMGLAFYNDIMRLIG